MIKGRTHVSSRKTLPSDASPQVGTFFPFAAGLASQSPGGHILPVFVCSLPPSADKSRDPPLSSPPSAPTFAKRRVLSIQHPRSSLSFFGGEKSAYPRSSLHSKSFQFFPCLSPAPTFHVPQLERDERLCLKTQDATAAPYSSRSRRGISGHFSPAPRI